MICLYFRKVEILFLFVTLFWWTRCTLSPFLFFCKLKKRWRKSVEFKKKQRRLKEDTVKALYYGHPCLIKQNTCWSHQDLNPAPFTCKADVLTRRHVLLIHKRADRDINVRLLRHSLGAAEFENPSVGGSWCVPPFRSVVKPLNPKLNSW